MFYILYIFWSIFFSLVSFISCDNTRVKVNQTSTKIIFHPHSRSVNISKYSYLLRTPDTTHVERCIKQQIFIINFYLYSSQSAIIARGFSGFPLKTKEISDAVFSVGREVSSQWEWNKHNNEWINGKKVKTFIWYEMKLGKFRLSISERTQQPYLWGRDNKKCYT